MGVQGASTAAGRWLRRWWPRRRSPPPPPRERGLPLVGSALALAQAGGPARLHAFVHERHGRLGPLFRMRLGPADGVFVADPSTMRAVFALEGARPRGLLPDAWLLYNRLHGTQRGLFFMEGEEWFQNRSILNKLILGTNNLSIIASACDQVISDLITRWRLTSGEEQQDLDHQLYLWSLEVMVSVLLGSTYKVHRENLLPAMKHVSSVVRSVFHHTARISLIPAQMAYSLGLSVWKDFEKAVTETLSSANNLTDQMVYLRNLDQTGLLSRMFEAGLDLKTVKRIIADFILAAGDTTVYTLQWILLELAKNPEIQEELHQQCLLVESPMDLVQISLVKWVLRETLRLYPVAIFLTRYLPQDCTLAGYKIDAGTLVMLSLYTSGRDVTNFDDPEKFWPQRWNRNAQDSSYLGVKTPYGTIPFAMGSRSCIGRRIAEMQLCLTVARLMKYFRVEVSNQNSVKLSLQMIAVPSEPLKLKLIRR